jgi:hypothetical protein
VIDATAGVMYVVTYTSENGAPVYRIHELTIPGFSEVTNTIVSGARLLSEGQQVFNFNAEYYHQRPALLEANGNAYAAFGAFCDVRVDVSRGIVLGWNAATLQPAFARPYGGQGLFHAVECDDSRLNLKTAVGRLEVAAFCDFARSGCVSLVRDAAAGATIDL